MALIVEFALPTVWLHGAWCMVRANTHTHTRYVVRKVRGRKARGYKIRACKVRGYMIRGCRTRACTIRGYKIRGSRIRACKVRGCRTLVDYLVDGDDVYGGVEG